MTDQTALRNLASLVARSSLASSDEAVRNTALGALATRLVPRTQRRSVSELLATIVAISARTRRVVMAPVFVELDVFDPTGERTVELSFKD